jgi:hypothetical protein
LPNKPRQEKKGRGRSVEGGTRTISTGAFTGNGIEEEE